MEGVAKLCPDAIEILPGILPRIITHLKQRMTVPLIAGGLIQTVGEVEKILASGATAISTTRQELWELDHDSTSLNLKPLTAPK
jgi:glycerol uptake operon antiterminator